MDEDRPETCILPERDGFDSLPIGILQAEHHTDADLLVGLHHCIHVLRSLGASTPHAATDALLVRAHGFDSDMIIGLARGGLATAECDTMKAGEKSLEVGRFRITAVGRKAIEW